LKHSEELKNQIRLSLKMSNYSKKEAEEWLREKYKIAMMIKDYKLAKEYFLKIREIKDVKEWNLELNNNGGKNENTIFKRC